MKLLLLHGPAVNKSRQTLTDFKKKFDSSNIVVFDKGTDLQTILGSLSTYSLLSEEQLFILENPPEDLDFDPFTFPGSLTVIFWFDHEVAKKEIAEYVKKHGQILFFPEGKEITVFSFLYYLANKEISAFLELGKLKKGFDIHYFLTMTYYLLRKLVVTPKGAPQFVLQKLQKQRQNFNLEKVMQLYKDVIEIEFKIKSGLLEENQAEFLLVSKFTGSPNL